MSYERPNECGDCNGRGEVVAGYRGDELVAAECETCDGRGVITPEACRRCHGEGVVERVIGEHTSTCDPGRFELVECERCDGTGEVLP